MDIEMSIFNHAFPKALSEDELNALFIQVKNGDMKAREKVIIHNLRLVTYVSKNFYSAVYDKEDIVSLGICGLIRAVDTFDLDKGYKFSSYATRCISNEIKMFLRTEQKQIIADSLDEILFNDNKLDIKKEDVISDDTDVEESCEQKELYRIIKRYIQELPERERNIIELYYGLNGNIRLTQAELAIKFNLAQSYISKIIIKTLKKIKEQIVYDEEKTLR